METVNIQGICGELILIKSKLNDIRIASKSNQSNNTVQNTWNYFSLSIKNLEHLYVNKWTYNVRQGLHFFRDKHSWKGQHLPEFYGNMAQSIYTIISNTM